jgi:uncharacterized membrane protein YeaQ/YmgE (transglycosylase-associated protein family)
MDVVVAELLERRTEKKMEIGIISWIIVGLIAGILGKPIMPGRDPGGFLLTIVIGMVGALVGGFVVRLLGGTGVTGFNIWSIIVATLGAVILLALYRLIAGPRRV